MDAALSVPIALLAGLVSFASPCFLPIVPVFIGYLAGTGNGSERAAMAFPSLARVGVADSQGFITYSPAAAKAAPRPKHSSPVLQAAVFVGAFSLVFIALWGLVALVGWIVGDVRPILRIAGGIVLIVMGLHAMGLIKIPFLERSLRVRYSPDQNAAPTVRRSFLLGLAFGLGWSPCIGPTLGAIIGLAVTTESMASGIGLLVVYCLGLGIPFILLAAGFSRLTPALAWLSRHQRTVALVTGIMLIVVGFLMVTDLFSRVSAFTWISL